MKKFKLKLLEQIKTIFMISLFICSVTLATVYITRAQSSILLHSDNFDFSLDNLSMVIGSDIFNNKLNETHYLPGFIGYKIQNNQAKGIISDYNNIKKLYSELSIYLIKLLGSNAECRITDDESVWEERLNGNNYIYIKYNSELPNTLIYAYLNNDIYIENMTTAVNITEILIVLNNFNFNQYSYTMYTRDSRGTTAEFIYNYDEDDTPLQYLDTAFLNFYNNLACNFKFNFSNNIFYNSTILFDSDITVKGINAADFYIDHNVILRYFKYNLDRKNTYQEDNGRTSIYVDEKNTIKINESGVISYDGAGIEINEYLKYSGEYTVIHMLLATEKFIDGFVKSGEAEVNLYKIYTQNDSLIIEYVYNFNGILLYDSEYNPKPIIAYRFVIKDGYFIAVNINAVDIRDMKANRKSLTQSRMIKIYEDMFSEQSVAGDLKLGYIIDTDMEIIIPEWIYIYEEPS